MRRASEALVGTYKWLPLTPVRHMPNHPAEAEHYLPRRLASRNSLCPRPRIGRGSVRPPASLLLPTSLSGPRMSHPDITRMGGPPIGLDWLAPALLCMLEHPDEACPSGKCAPFVPACDHGGSQSLPALNSRICASWRSFVEDALRGGPT